MATPFSDTCPPLFAKSAPAGTDRALAGALDEYRRERGANLEVRGPVDHLDDASSEVSYYHHVVELDSNLDSLQARFARTRVRGSEKARREGVTVEERRDPAALDLFYPLHLTTRRRLGVPTQPKRFIRRLGSLMSDQLCFVLLAKVDHVAVAAAVFLEWNDQLTYKYSASDLRHARKRPTDALLMTAFGLACERGFTALDMGRTELDNDGLRSFKRSWGADERELAYTRLPEAAAVNEGPSVPTAVSTAIRRGPPWFGRALGRVFYKHSA